MPFILVLSEEKRTVHAALMAPMGQCACTTTLRGLCGNNLTVWHTSPHWHEGGGEGGLTSWVSTVSLTCTGHMQRSHMNVHRYKCTHVHM